MRISDTIRGLTLTIAVLLAGCETDRAARYDNPMDEDFTRAVDRAPTGRTLYAMGRLLAARGQDEQARFVFERALATEPTLTPVYNELAEVLLRQEATAEAMAVLQRGLDVEPNNHVLLNNMGMCHVLGGDFTAAKTYFDRALDQSPDNRRYQANRAMALGMLGEYDAAVREYSDIVTPAQANHNVAVICEAKGDTERAAELFRKAKGDASMP